MGRVWLAPWLLLFVACTGPRASGEWPIHLQWSSRYAGGNCADVAVVDERGQVRGSGGCEERSRAYKPRVLTSAQRTLLVRALDRLRATSSGEVAATTVPCREGTSIRLVERSGQERGWDFCDKPGSDAPAKPSAEATAVIGLVSE